MAPQTPTVSRAVHFYDHVGKRPFAGTVTSTLAEDKSLEQPLCIDIAVSGYAPPSGGAPVAVVMHHSVNHSDEPTPGVRRWCYPPRVP